MSRLVRTLAFTRNELVTTLRQPRMLLTLVLGPFLILFLFGLGYQHDLPPLSTLVVGNDDDLTAEVDAYIKETEPSSIDYRGTTQDRRTAMNQLRDGDIDLVIVLPENALQQIDRNRRAVIELYERTLDPLSSTQIWIAADAAVAEINDQVLARVIGNLQERTSEFTD
ncbi:MAG: hypothetical protein R3320_04585, partial [Nitriliruptorales bacterium]|nr:hypothetical protein [Nitriliruptorales bacterium]